MVNSEEKIKKPLVWLEISKKNLLQNVAQMKELVKPSKVMAVVKANAYGVGILGMASTIEREIDAFGVVGIKEALALREGGITKPILNLGIYSFEDAQNLAGNKISPAIFTYSAFQNFERTSKKLKTTSGAWIKVDTGLNRLGVPYPEALELIRFASKSKYVKIEGVFSTLTEDKKFDKIQLSRLLSVKEACQKLSIPISLWSIASSDAAFLFRQSCLDIVRLGISLLGFYPSKEARTSRKATLLPAVSFKTRVASVKELERGESVFYRRTFIAKRKTRIAILLAGNSYGLDSGLVNGGSVLIGGKKYPLVGGIAATNSFVDIGTDKTIKAGDEAVIFGKQKKSEVTLEEVCACLKQNEYQFLSRIPEKVERIYL